MLYITPQSFPVLLLLLLLLLRPDDDGPGIHDPPHRLHVQTVSGYGKYCHVTPRSFKFALSFRNCTSRPPILFSNGSGASYLFVDFVFGFHRHNTTFWAQCCQVAASDTVKECSIRKSIKTKEKSYSP
jgi:hypothetical protein